jgi:hypothetical protein
MRRIVICALPRYAIFSHIHSTFIREFHVGKAIFEAFAKFHKVTISFVMSDRPLWNNSFPTERIFMKFGIWVILENLWKKLKLF